MNETEPPNKGLLSGRQTHYISCEVFLILSKFAFHLQDRKYGIAD